MLHRKQIVTNDEEIKETEAVWCVIANVRKEILFGPGGNETKIGTKKFRGEAKVYIIDWYPGMCEDIIAIGQHRHSKSFIKCVIRAKAVENLRVKLAYVPKVV